MKYLLFILLFCFSVLTSCGNSYSSLPAASAGDKKITIGYIDYSLIKMKNSGAEKITRREAVENIISNILLSFKAAQLQLDKEPGFAEKSSEYTFEVRKKFLCNETEEEAACGKMLIKRLMKSHSLQVSEFGWDKVFLIPAVKDIPFMGALPEVNKSARPHEMLNKDYCNAVTISLEKVSLSLGDLLTKLDPEELNLMRILNNDEREIRFRDILLKQNIELLKADLKPYEQSLLSEIETRRQERHLADAFREHIGIKGDAADHDNSPIIKQITDSEAENFYKEFKEGFAITEWVEISHLRISDQQKAEAVHADLKEKGADFCTVVKELSTAPDKDMCGYVGIIKRETVKERPMYQTFAFTMPPGSRYSIPFRTDDGTEIIMVHKRQTRVPSFNEPGMKRSVKMRMVPLKRQEILINVLEEMKKTYPVIVYEKNLK